MTEAIGKKFQLPKPVDRDRLEKLEKYEGKLEKLIKEKVNCLLVAQLVASRATVHYRIFGYTLPLSSFV